MTCSVCSGSRHVLSPSGGWVRCSCVAKISRLAAYARAGVPEIYRSTPLSSLAAASVWRCRVSPPYVGQRVIGWLRGPRLSSARVKTIAYLLRVHIDAGVSAFRVSLTDLVQSRFAVESRSAMADRLADTSFLVVDLDTVLNNKMVPQVLSELLAARAEAVVATVWASEDDVPACPAKYGDSLSSFLGSARSVVRVSCPGQSGGSHA